MTSTYALESMARLHVNLREIIDFFAAAGIQSRSIEKLEQHLDSHQYAEFLDLANGFCKCMAFIDHDWLVSKLATSWSNIEEMLMLERKVISRKLRNLESDKNADPEIIQKLHNSKVEIESRKANALVHALKFRIISGLPLKNFKDPKYDPMTASSAVSKMKKAKANP